MFEQEEQLRHIHKLTYDAYKTSGQLALLFQEHAPPEAIAKSLETAAARLEESAIETRALCEACHPPAAAFPGQYPSANGTEVLGLVDLNAYGWLHIQLNTLLPHCRYSTPFWLSNSITHLLDRYESRRGKLPFFKHALLVIDEHCDIRSRQVYDQDNKGWRAVSNALKGRVVPDDDQYTLGICLLSQQLPERQCNIFVLPEHDAGDFFYMRSENAPSYL